MMSLETVKLMLENQSQAYNNVLDCALKQFIDKVSQIERTTSDLRKSLEYSQAEIDILKNEIKQLKQEKQAENNTTVKLQHELSETVAVVRRAEAHCNNLDDLHRRNNLMIDGLPEDNVETSEQIMVKVSGLLQDKLELPQLPLETAQRLGQRREDRPRPVLVRFTKLADRDAAMRNARKLRGTNIFLNDDLCPASQKIKTDQIPAMKEARSQGKIAFFIGTKLIIKERESARGPRVAAEPPIHTDGGANQSQLLRRNLRSQSHHQTSSN